MSNQTVKNQGTAKKTGSQDVKAVKKVSAKKGSKKKKQKTKKDYLQILAIIGILAGVSGGVYQLIFGSAFQLQESEYPIGYYQLILDNPCSIPIWDQDFDIKIYNRTELVRTLTVVDGKFSSSNDYASPVYYASEQSWAAIVKDGFKTVFKPLECSEDEEDPVVNDLTILKRSYNHQINYNIKLATTELYNYTTFNLNTPFSLLSNTSYNLYIYMNFEYVENRSYWCGTQINVTDDILPPIAKSLEFNTDAHLLIMKGVIENVTLTWGLILQPNVIEYLGEKYSVLVLPGLFLNSPMFYEISFAINSPTEWTDFQICILDGFLDFAFDGSYPYYKLGGF